MIVLQEPDRQVVITAVWAGESPDFQRVIDGIIETIELRKS
jgi:hypothetical protein